MIAYHVEAMPTIKTHRIALAPAIYQIINTPIRGSYNLLAARLFGLSYADYLRMVRDNYGAVLNGREGYIIFTIQDKTQAEKLVKELNRRWNIVFKNQVRKD